MREIKFRAWDKTMSYMDYRVRISHFKDVIEVLDSWSTWRELKKDEYTLMQYTGLKDKNGVEIYEGDIVNHYWSNEVGESFCHKTVIKNPFDYKVNEAMHLIYADELEILGNIYENPELLEETNGE